MAEVQGIPGVVVLGMHRSGTSATTGALQHTGLRLSDECYLMPPNAGNPRGYFENKVLVPVNDDLLAMFHADWSGPPASIGGWDELPGAAHLRERARAAFHASMPAHGWLWKDPRNCLTLPFWIDVLGVRPAAVLVHRAPGQIARSLRKRDGFTLHLGLALWEHYMHALLANVVGMPVVVCRFDDLLDDPVATVVRMCDDLAALGAPVGPIDEEAVAGIVSPSLPSASGRDGGSTDVVLSPEQRELVSVIEGLENRYDGFSALELPPVTATTTAFVEERRRHADDRRRLEEDHRRVTRELEERDTVEQNLRKRLDALLEGRERFVAQRETLLTEREALQAERLELKAQNERLQERYRSDVEALPVWFRKSRSAYRRVRRPSRET